MQGSQSLETSPPDHPLFQSLTPFSPRCKFTRRVIYRARGLEITVRRESDGSTSGSNEITKGTQCVLKTKNWRFLRTQLGPSREPALQSLTIDAQDAILPHIKPPTTSEPH